MLQKVDQIEKSWFVLQKDGPCFKRRTKLQRWSAVLNAVQVMESRLVFFLFLELGVTCVKEGGLCIG